MFLIIIDIWPTSRKNIKFENIKDISGPVPVIIIQIQIQHILCGHSTYCKYFSWKDLLQYTK